MAGEQLVERMTFSRICRDFIEPNWFHSIYIKCITSSSFKHIMNQWGRSIRSCFSSLLQKSLPVTVKGSSCACSLLSCSWRPSVLSDNFTALFPLSFRHKGPLALGQMAWTAQRDGESIKRVLRKMPLACALEERDEKLFQRVHSEKHTVTGLVEDSVHDWDPTWPVASSRPQRAKHKSLQRNPATGHKSSLS